MKIKLITPQLLLVFACLFGCIQLLQGQAWNLTGNTGTSTSHFIGTTDAKDLRFRTSNIQRMVINSSGFIGIGSPVAAWPAFRFDVRQGSINTDSLYRIKGSPVVSLGGGGLVSNIGLGTSALLSNTTGSFNTAGGQNALRNNTSGGSNVALGAGALQANSTASFNVAVGASALSSNTTGTQNTSIGTNAMKNNVSGSGNTANGYHALLASTASSKNSAFGAFTLSSNTSGTDNTSVGYAALNFNTTGIQNTAIGANTLQNNTIGNSNNAFGYGALSSNTSGSQNIAFGNTALVSNTTGSHNQAIGNYSLYTNSTGTYNAALGTSSMYSNTTGNYNVAVGFGGLYGNINGSLNVAVGADALRLNTSGSLNTAIGGQTLAGNIDGLGNSAIGYQALQMLNMGNNSTALGKHSLRNTTQGTNITAAGVESGLNNFYGINNTFIGVGADVSVSSLSYTNSTAIGFAAVVDSDNKVRIGNTAVMSIGGQVGWTTYSDGRYKTNIKEDIPGLDFINKLRPVSYTTDINGINNHLTKGMEYMASSIEQQNYSNQEQKRYTGFIAQEVEEAASGLGYEFSGVDKPQHDGNLYGIRYAEFVVPIVKAIQEQQVIIEKQQEQIAALQELVTQQANNASLRINKVSEEVESILGQNIPNPVDQSTIIPFKIPHNCSSASILITEQATGKAIRAIQLNCEATQVMLDAGMLSAGCYMYSLFVDGIMVDSKRMIITH